MAIGDLFRVNRKTFFNPRAWINYEVIRDSTLMAWGLLMAIFTVPTPEREETFEQAKARLKLTEADIQQAGRNYFIYAVIFALIGVVVFIYSFYLLIVHHTGHGWLIGLSVSALFLGQSFRFHFWYFQIKHHKLGCTFAEWRQGWVRHRKRS